MCVFLFFWTLKIDFEDGFISKLCAVTLLKLVNFEV